jgi:hypothetical protein
MLDCQRHLRRRGQTPTDLAEATIDASPPIWPHHDAENARDDKAGHDTQTPSQMPNSNVLGLSVFEGHEETMAGSRNPRMANGKEVTNPSRPAKMVLVDQTRSPQPQD